VIVRYLSVHGALGAPCDGHAAVLPFETKMAFWGAWGRRPSQGTKKQFLCPVHPTVVLYEEGLTTLRMATVDRAVICPECAIPRFKYQCSTRVVRL
jgi:hypothetical protein